MDIQVWPIIDNNTRVVSYTAGAVVKGLPRAEDSKQAQNNCYGIISELITSDVYVTSEIGYTDNTHLRLDLPYQYLMESDIILTVCVINSLHIIENSFLR